MTKIITQPNPEDPDTTIDGDPVINFDVECTECGNKPTVDVVFHSHPNCSYQSNLCGECFWGIPGCLDPTFW